LAIGKGEIPEEKIPIHLKKLDKDKVEFNGIKVKPSFGGSAFEHGMPAIFVDEVNLSPLGFGINLKKAFYIQMLQAREKNYPVWGESPSIDENYGYDTFGSPSGIQPYPTRGVITPHASFLALEVLPERAGENLDNIAYLYFGAYKTGIGFADAINVNNNEVLFKYLALDQGMSFLAGLNFISGGTIKNLFMQSEEGRRIAEVISGMEFFTRDELNKEAEDCYQLGKEYIERGDWEMGEVLINYVQDLAQSYSLEIDFSDLSKYQMRLEELKQNTLISLYQKAVSEINSGKLKEAENTLIHLLGIDRNYLDAFQKLEYTRSQIYR
ncbi:MAG: glucoamylase family protein, partial [Candidatus Omnitrophota bacterium]